MHYVRPTGPPLFKYNLQRYLLIYTVFWLTKVSNKKLENRTVEFTRKCNKVQCNVMECTGKRWRLSILSRCHANLTRPIRHKESQPYIFNIYLWTTDQDTVAYYKLNSLITARYIRFVPVVGTRKHSTQGMSVFKKAWLIQLHKKKIRSLSI